MRILRRRKGCILCGLTFLLIAPGSLPSFAQCSFPAQGSPNILNYSFEPVIADKKMSLVITLEFNGGPTGKAKLQLPSYWAGQQHAENSITELKALSAGAILTDTKSPSEKKLQFPPGSIVRISYVLAKDWDGPLNGRTRFRADLSLEYFHLIGKTALVYPDMDEHQKVDLHFDWQKLPSEWSLATSFGTDRCQSFRGTLHDALNSLFVGGDYRIYRTTIAGNALNFAIRGKWSFTDDEWVNQVGKIIEFERAFWHDNNFPYFLVTLTQLDQDYGSTGGTALTNVFMVHLSRLDPFSSEAIRTIAHETFHTWNPLRMGDRPGSDYSASWFSEGFTVYYADLMLFRAGLISFPDYVSALDEKLRQYELHEGIDVTLGDFIRRHSADHSALDQLDYRRGAVLAIWLDTSIRQKSANQSSLDKLMFDLVRQNEEYERHHAGKPLALTNRRIFHAAAKYLDRESRMRLRIYVERGGPIQVQARALGPCTELTNETLENFDLGFDRRSTRSDDKVVFGVEPGSEAYKAGLRDGHQLLNSSIHNGDPSKQVRLTINTADGDQVIAYYPRGSKVQVQQFSLDAKKYSSNPKLCTAILESP
jgi:predicted metalloprotease with PDZ domain